MTEEFKTTNDIPAAEAKAEGQKLEWLDKPMEVYFGDIRNTIDRLNSELPEGEKPWRMPTKDELLMAIKNGEVDNTRSLKLRWCWTSSRMSDEDAKLFEESLKGQTFDERQLFYVVKRSGEVDTAILDKYGLRLVRDTD